jgi:type II secretory pathway pseudopilin PulG
VPTVDIDRDTAHDAAQNELSKPIYPHESLTERLVDWIDEMLYRLVLKGSTAPGGWFTIMVLLIIVTVAVVVAVRVARRTMRTSRVDDSELFGAAELAAAEHRATAERCVARGDWAAAIRHRLRAVARHLEETGVLTPIPGRTAGELARDASAKLPGLSPDFSYAAMVFNDVTYGARHGTQAAYRSVADLDDRLRTRAAAAGRVSLTAPGDDGWAHVR